MELGELHRTIHGRTAEREVASGEMYRKTRKHGSDAMSQNVRSGSPRAGPSLTWGTGGHGGLGHGEDLSNQLLPKKVEAWAPGQ